MLVKRGRDWGKIGGGEAGGADRVFERKGGYEERESVKRRIDPVFILFSLFIFSYFS